MRYSIKTEQSRKSVKDAQAKQDAELGITWRNNTKGGIVAISVLLGVMAFGAYVIFELRNSVPIF